VPAVAAEYWGVTLDVVWDRIHSDLVPHKTEQGFVFIDVDPWRIESTRLCPPEPPPTYVPASSAPEIFAPACSATLVREPALSAQEHAFLLADSLSDDEELILQRDGQGEDDDLGDLTGADDQDDDEELPDLDEEESATFGRLSWQDVRQSVSRTRRPPPRAA